MSVAAMLDAVSLIQAGRHAPAEDLLRQVLESDPDDASALFLLGDCALLGHRPREAVGLLSRAVAARPRHRDSRLALARAELATGRAAEALDVLAPLANETGLAAAQVLRGTALNALGRPAEAIAAFRATLAVVPDHAEALLNCGNAHADLDDWMEAERLLRQAVLVNPRLAEAHASLGHLLAAKGELDEAVAANGRAIALKPDLAAAHWNQGVALLLAGRMAEGWREYEWRKRRFPDAFTAPPGPVWEGERLDGRTLLVIAEQGHGDAIQFARYLPLLVERGARVLLQCAPSLVRLLGTIPGVTACPRGRHPASDVWVDQMSLPLLFGTKLESIPVPSGYLAPRPVEAARWDARLPPGLRVGLAWAGNPLHSNDRNRSVPAVALQPLIGAVRGLVVPLQVGERAHDLARLYGIGDHAAELVDWAATAAAVSVLDLVITVDTAVAHLAGALGIPVWLMLPHAPDWRWMLRRSDSPWYSGMRLFRQSSPGDWHGVVASVAEALAGIAQPVHSMAMPPLTCSVAPVTHAAASEAR